RGLPAATILPIRPAPIGSPSAQFRPRACGRSGWHPPAHRLSGWSLAVRCPAQIEASGPRSADRAARIGRAVYEPELFTHAALKNAGHTRAAEVAPATPLQFLSTFGAGFLGVQSGRLGGDANRERRGKSEKKHLDAHVCLPARFDRQPALAAPSSRPT